LSFVFPFLLLRFAGVFGDCPVSKILRSTKITSPILLHLSGHFPPGNPWTHGIEGTVKECSVTESTSLGCDKTKGWPLHCFRSNARFILSSKARGTDGIAKNIFFLFRLFLNIFLP
jgi:hypothetical protein